MTVARDLVVRASAHDTLDSIAEQARLAEELGFDRVSAGETTGRDMVTTFAVVGERTERIGISTDVLSPFGRAPTALAQTALTMHEATGGRFRLGLGTSSPAIAERWHGAAFDRPLRRLRETIDIVHEVYEGGRVSYDGDVFDIGGLAYDRPVPDDPPPIDVAALGPKAVELAGRFADGWVPQLFTPDGLADRLGDLDRGAGLGDRSTDEVRVAPLIRCCASVEDPAGAREATRSTVAFLVGAYGPFYGQSVAEQGYSDVVDEVRAAWDDRDTAAMAAALPDDLLDELAACGTPETVRERLDTFATVDGVDAVRVGFVEGMDREDERETLEAVVG
ncbi:TIGR04024 family LLM class F420-dependent oxidoreductase [Halomarina oriensis]|uniref:TIGR04024 family LLM class F420-dependent oxidoreductase n=1 Tax=Halomarina oriensis TaxID=671145 RepID=A0A6B0GGB9_9EURY|nr:TIGR04024 family LLM class F420-dependent oxidoreductase [Halomarina oriensis]MWG33057.1 TIGR04024 family LLM class F420-dependent oxidoreductase [Halomarina oriensis]